MNPAPLKHLRHQKGWRLTEVSIKLKAQGTPISWPTLVNIDHGYRSVIVRDKAGKKIREKKAAYKPFRRTLADIAKLFKVKPEDVYEDRSKE